MLSMYTYTGKLVLVFSFIYDNPDRVLALPNSYPYHEIIRKPITFSDTMENSSAESALVY